MRILFLYNESSERSPVVNPVLSTLICPAFWTRAMGTHSEVVTTMGSDSAWDEQYDIVLVYNALELFLANRFKLKGRPWTAILSFQFSDTYSFYTNSVQIQDMGIDAIFTNCKPFVERAAPQLPIRFIGAPTGFSKRNELPHVNCTALIGAYVSRLQDQDFSLLKYCVRVLRDLGYIDRFRLFVHPQLSKSDISSIPVEGMTTVVSRLEDSGMRVYIPTPYMSDILMGVVGSELLLACQLSFFPLLIRHNKFTSFQKGIPTYDSLNRVKDFLKTVCGLPDSVPCDLGKNFKATDDELLQLIAMAYRRKKYAPA